MFSRSRDGAIVGSAAFFGEYGMQSYSYPLGRCWWDDEAISIDLRGWFWKLHSRFSTNYWGGVPLGDDVTWVCPWSQIAQARLARRSVTFVTNAGGCVTFMTPTARASAPLGREVEARAPVRRVRTNYFSLFLVGTVRAYDPPTTP